MSTLFFAFLFSHVAQAFLNTAHTFCTGQEVSAHVTRQKTPMSAYKHGSTYVFLIFKTQHDMALMFDRPGDFITRKTIERRHTYDRDVEGYALAHKDMVAFFEYARTHNIPLNLQEQKLQRSLLENGHMKLEQNRYSLQSPIYLGAAYKGAHRDTVEHELNHMLFDSTPSYRSQVQKVYQRLSIEQKHTVTTVLQKMGYDKKTLSIEDNLLGEFAAFFRDPQALKASYANNLSGISTAMLNAIAAPLIALEKETSLFTHCP